LAVTLGEEVPEQTVPPVEPEPAVRLPRGILRESRSPAPAPSPPDLNRQPSFRVGRQTDNELILFDDAAEESWIVYPPRSAYEFLAVRRRAASMTVVEHHPWSYALTPVDHVLDPRTGCLAHGVACRAQLAISTAVQLGYDPFT
jgi:hypothetical protein